MAQTFKPRMPYLFGGHNQITARRAHAEMIKVLGLTDKVEKPIPQRIEKKAIRHYDALGCRRMNKLPRPARRLVLTWAQDEVRSVQSVLAGLGCE